MGVPEFNLKELFIVTILIGIVVGILIGSGVGLGFFISPIGLSIFGGFIAGAVIITLLRRF